MPVRILVLCLAFGAAPALAAAQSASPAPPAESSALVERGTALFERGHYDAALVHLLAAHDLMQGHPRRHRVLYNIALCYERSFRYEEALSYYDRFLTEGGATDPNAGEVRAIVAALDELLGTVQVQGGPANGELWVDDHLVTREATEIRVPAGTHAIERRAEGFFPVRQEVRIVAGQTRVLHIELRAVDAFRGLPEPVFWTSLATSLATIAVGSGFGIESLLQTRAIETRLASPVERWAVQQAEIDAVASTSLIADVLFGVGGALALTSLVFAFVTEWDPPDAEATAGVRATPAGVAGWF